MFIFFEEKRNKHDNRDTHLHLHIQFFHAEIFTSVFGMLMLLVMGDNKVYGFSLCGTGY